jgi:hypothetical protein
MRVDVRTEIKLDEVMKDEVEEESRVDLGVLVMEDDSKTTTLHHGAHDIATR